VLPPRCPRIAVLRWLRGEDLNLRPSGYEEAATSLLGLLCLQNATIAHARSSATLAALPKLVTPWPRKWPRDWSGAGPG
jgi:hypothetical protein